MMVLQLCHYFSILMISADIESTNASKVNILVEKVQDHGLHTFFESTGHDPQVPKTLTN